LDEERDVREEVQGWLPEARETKLPNDVGEVEGYFREEELNGKIVGVWVYLSRIETQRIIYKLCY
jgi:hypothetical protein